MNQYLKKGRSILATLLCLVMLLSVFPPLIAQAEEAGASDVIWQLSQDSHIQSLEIGNYDNILAGTPFLTGAGSPTFTIVPSVQSPGSNAIEISNRSAHWNALDVLLSPMNLTVGQYEIILYLRFEDTPVGNFVIGSPAAPWNNMNPAVPNTASMRIARSFRHGVEGGAWSAAGGWVWQHAAMRPQTAGPEAAGTLTYIVDNIIIRHTDDRTPPNAPAAPTLYSATHNTVVLTPVAGMEFALYPDGDWQSSNAFTGLTPETEYRFIQRIAAVSPVPASAASPPLTVTTLAPAVDGFDLHPEAITLAPGRTRGFIPVGYDGEVTWAISGNTNDDTYINAGGFLRIDAEESAPFINVTATSVANNTQTGTAVVTISDVSVIDGLTRGLNYYEYPSLREHFADFFLIGGAGDGNINTGSFQQTATNPHTSFIRHHLNAWTFENSMKPTPLRGAAGPNGGWSVGPTNTIAGARNAYPGMNMIGHTLTWHSQSPATFWNVPTREIAWNGMYSHIRGVFDRWGHELQAIDVVNEAMGSIGADEAHNWRQSLTNLNMGWVMSPLGSDWVESAFIAAAMAVDYLDLDVVLYYNDFGEYGLIRWTAIYHMVRDINTRHANGTLLHPITGEVFQRPLRDGVRPLLIEGVGMQGHYTGASNFNNVSYNINRFAALGVRISITELDVSWVLREGNMLTPEEELAQAQVYAEIFQMLMRYAAGPANAGSPYPSVIERVTFWGLHDQQSWRAGARPLLFNGPLAGGQLTGKDALLAALDPWRFLELNPIPDPEPAYNPGVYVFHVEDGDAFTGMNIILGSDADVWPWSTGGETGRVAFTPEPGATYRLVVHAINRGAYGLEVHWLNDNSEANFTAANVAAIPTMPVATNGNLPGVTIANRLPARATTGGVAGAPMFFRADITMPADGLSGGLLGNIGIRGVYSQLLGGNHPGIELLEVSIQRVVNGVPVGDLIVNWPVGVEPEPRWPHVPGITSYSPLRGDTFAGVNIVAGTGRDVWPHGDGLPGNERAFIPTPDGWYRISINARNMGAGGYRVRWGLAADGGPTAGDYVIVNAAAANIRPSSFGAAIPVITDTTPIADRIPGHQQTAFNAQGTHTIITDIQFRADEEYNQLIGNIFMRGTGGSNSFAINWVLIERLEGGHRSDVVEVLNFYPFGLENFEAFRDNPIDFIDYLEDYTIALTGGGALATTITRDDPITVVNADNPPRVGDTLVAGMNGGTSATMPNPAHVGTTSVHLVGTTTYTWRIGTGAAQQVIQSSTDNYLIVPPEALGLAISVQITSDWETGTLTSTNTVATQPAPVPPTYIELPSGGTGYIIRDLEDWEYIVPQLGTRLDIVGLWLELEEEITVPQFIAPLRAFAIYGNGNALRIPRMDAAAGAILTLNNVNITATNPSNRLAIVGPSNTAGGTVIMNGGSFVGTWIGGVHIGVGNNGTFILNDGIVSSATGPSQGVVDLQNNATFNMYGGTVTRTGGQGADGASTGAVRFSGGIGNSVFNMRGGLINGAPHGVALSSGIATFNMFAGTIEGTTRSVLIGGTNTAAASRTFNFYGGNVASVGVHQAAANVANGFINAIEPLDAAVYVGRLLATGTAAQMLAANVTMTGIFTAPITVERGVINFGDATVGAVTANDLGIINVNGTVNGIITNVAGTVTVNGTLVGCVIGEYIPGENGVVTHFPGDKVVYLPPTCSEYGIWHIYCESCGALVEYGPIPKLLVFTGTNPNVLMSMFQEGDVVLRTAGNLGIFAHHADFYIPEGRTLIIETTLNVHRGADLRIYGTLVIAEGGRLNNQGGVDGALRSRITVAPGGTLINYGLVENVSGSVISNCGAIINTGLFNIRAGTLYSLRDCGTFEGTYNKHANARHTPYLCICD